MKLQQQLEELVRACFTGIWVATAEAPEAVREITDLGRRHQWQVASWDVEQGLSLGGQVPAADTVAGDPLAVLRSLSSLGQNNETTLLVLRNFHRFLNSTEVIEAVTRAILDGKSQRTIVVVLAPVVKIPVELEKLFVVVDHEYPDANQLLQIAQEIATAEGELPTGREQEKLLEAAAGLTRFEAENAFSLSLVRHERLEAASIWELKTQLLRKSGQLSLYRGEEDFSSLGGLDALKAFTRRALLKKQHPNRTCKPRGVMLLSPPGCGKSQFCKALGREVGRPVILLDVGSLLGSLVGQSEERTRAALKTIDAMAPCIAMIDEVDKAFAGGGGSGQNDGGVSARMFGTFLSWLNDHDSDVFVVCTANDVTKLPPEFSRSERFDGVFFVDLPGREQKDAIWRMYIESFDIAAQQPLPSDDNWTGAEIRACCRLAALLDLPLTEAARNVVPVSVTAAESVQRLRDWASGRCLDAQGGGIYAAHPVKQAGRRKVNRGEPSNN